MKLLGIFLLICVLLMRNASAGCGRKNLSVAITTTFRPINSIASPAINSTRNQTVSSDDESIDLGVEIIDRTRN